MDELKPCPFCGRIAAISYNNVFGFVPWCTNEDCMLNENTYGYETWQEATEAWNRRAEDG